MPELNPKTVMLVDDHALFRDGLAFVLRGFDPTIEIVQARSAEEAIGMGSGRVPQLILLDMQMRGLSGAAAVTAIKEVFSESMVVALSGSEDPSLVLDVIGAGASGFIPKATESIEFYDAIRTVLRGDLFLPKSSLLMSSDPALALAASTPALRQTAGSSAVVTSSGRALIGMLSPRQAEALLLMMQGLPNKLIARNMRIGESTVKSYTQSIFQAMGVHNRTEAVFHAMRAGLTVADVSSLSKQSG